MTCTRTLRSLFAATLLHGAAAAAPASAHGQPAGTAAPTKDAPEKQAVTHKPTVPDAAARRTIAAAPAERHGSAAAPGRPVRTD